MTEIKVTDSFEAERVLHSEMIWITPVDDVTIEVMPRDLIDAREILADRFLLQSLVDFANSISN